MIVIREDTLKVRGAMVLPGLVVGSGRYEEVITVDRS